MPRNPAAADAEAYRPELLAEDEPRYLRRQKPVEIRRKKFGGRNWSLYRRVFVWSMAGAVGFTAAVLGGRFLLYSPEMLLLKPDQIEIAGNHIVARDAILEKFYRDRGHSVVRIPLETRRSAIEQLSWVESASVQRILPNRIRVELTERTPIAFLRVGTELALIDAYGVILDRPAGEDLHFPIVTGLSENLPREERQRRMEIYQQFLQEIDSVKADSSDQVSEVDLSNPKDLRAVMAGFPGSGNSQAVTIHFGAPEFSGKYRMLIDNFAQWQANAGCVQSVDLQFSRQVVLNPDSNACGPGSQPGAAAALRTASRRR